MSALLKFAVLSEGLYAGGARSDPRSWLTPETWLRTVVADLWNTIAERNVAEELHQSLSHLKLDHVGSLVALEPSECSALLLEHGYSEVQTQASVVVAGIIGVPVTIVEGHMGDKRLEFFCPERRGLACSKKELVHNWGCLGYGVHVGFRSTSRTELFEAVKTLCLGQFIAPDWARYIDGPQGLVYLDGFIEGHRIRVEVRAC